MSVIHLVDGAAGSVGKSLFCRTLLHHYISHQLNYQLVEAHLSHPDVSLLYDPNCPKVDFAHSDRPNHSPDIIFDLALKQPVIVHLPGYSFYGIEQWNQRTGLIEQAKQHQLQIVRWFLCKNATSFNQMEQSCLQYREHIHHALVLNQFFQKEWTLTADWPLTVKMPKLPDKERNWLDAHGVRFDQVNQSSLPLLSKQRIHTFLKGISKQINEIQRRIAA